MKPSAGTTGAGDICEADATTLASWIRGRQVSATEVANAVIGRADTLDPELGAICTRTFEAARVQAAQTDREIADGEPLGPLAGVPVSVKDLILTRGVRTAMGSSLYRDFVPDEDDIVVERLRAAGAVLLGKTNTSELGYAGHGRNPLFAPTRNPWGRNLTPGGSSAGAAVAVATGMGPLALGSDGGGSIRIPAAFCGVFGFKPSFGRAPLYPGCRDERYPGASSWESLECIGPLSRTVRDAALLLDVIAGPDPRDRHSLPAAPGSWRDALDSGIAGLKIAYSADLGGVAVDTEVANICSQAAQTFERDLGCHVEGADPDWRGAAAAYAALEALETDLTGLRRLAGAAGQALSPALMQVLDRQWTAEEFTDAIVARKRISNATARLFSRYDLLLTPTLGVPPFALELDDPPEIGGRPAAPGEWAAFVYPLNMTGNPASSVPAGWTAGGLPVGLQIVGPHLGDALVLRASAAFERVRPWAQRWPGAAASPGHHRPAA